MVELVPFTRLFLDKSFDWLSDPEIQYLTDTPPLTRNDQEKWFLSLAEKDNYRVWGVCFQSLPVGVCGIKHIEGPNGEYFGYIGEKSLWGQGIGNQMMERAERLAEELNISHLRLRVANDNARAIRLYQKRGYTPSRHEDRFTWMEKNLKESIKR